MVGACRGTPSNALYHAKRAFGGTARGVEDSLYIGPGKRRHPAEQVTKIRSIIENLGLSVATSAEARERLGQGCGSGQILSGGTSCN